MHVELRCPNCNNISPSHEEGFILTLPTVEYSFKKNLEKVLFGKVDYFCEKCNLFLKFTFKKTMIEKPDYLMIQLMRYKYNDQLGIVEKDFKFIELPENLFLPNTNAEYKLKGVIYHVGDTSQSGHYFAKHITLKGIETYDDSRCYLNPIEKHLICNNAYLILYKKVREIEEEEENSNTEQTHSLNAIQKDNLNNFDEGKIKNLFSEYSDLITPEIFDAMNTVDDEVSFTHLFGSFCDQLLTFNLLDFERLYEFTQSFIDKGIQSTKFLFKSILIAAHKRKRISKNIEKTIILFLHKCIENHIIKIEQIYDINEEVSIEMQSSNKKFGYIISNLEDSFLSIAMEETD